MVVHSIFAYWSLSSSLRYDLLFVQWYNRPRPAPSTHWGCWLIRLIEVGMRDILGCMHRCVARTIAMRILNFIMLEVSEEDFFLISWRDFLQDFVLALLCLGFISKHSITWMNPQRDRKSDGVDPGRLGGISCRMVHQDSWYARTECHQLVFPEFPD